MKNSNVDLSNKKEDLVDHITQAANKLIKDPNSYYHNLKKEEKVQISQMMIREEEEKNHTANFAAPSNDAQIGKMTMGQQPIQPYPKSKYSPTKKESSKRKGRREMMEEEDDSGLSEAEKRQKLFDSKPVIKKKKIDPPQAKLPPPPEYKPLPCLECKNIKNVCEELNIEKIEDVLKIVNENKHGKTIIKKLYNYRLLIKTARRGKQPTKSRSQSNKTEIK